MEILNDPDVRFTTSPESVMTYANFMADVGSIKQRPEVAGHVLPGHSWREGGLKTRTRFDHGLTGDLVVRSSS